jgi:hypothetical protein
VDYSFCEACQTINFIGLYKLMLIYDIMCQYWKRLALRIGRNEYLTLPQMELEKAIGLFHVHGHKPACLFRYASTFIPGAAMVDGEILETNWSILNRISKSLRTATLAHRAEVLDDHMNDHNWKKLVGIGKRTLTWTPVHLIYPAGLVVVETGRKKYLRAVQNLQESREYFLELTEVPTRAQIAQWEEEITNAEMKRFEEPEAMDIMEPRVPKRQSNPPDIRYC